MADEAINIFKSGTHNLIDDENIPKDAAQDSKNFITQDGKLKLAYGRKLIGTEGSVGMIRGLFFGYKVNGTKVLFRKTSTKIQYWNGSAWADVITGLTASAEYSFSNYSSLAGAFTIISGIDGIYKINTANPGSYVALYDAARNDKGKIMIDKGRLIMWDCANASKTVLKLSWIDRQNATVYTAVSAEVLGASGGQTYAGTLAFKAAGATRNCFAIQISGTVAAGVETFTDNKDGTLTGSRGGTGVINYATGAYSVTFSAITTSGNITANYQWEDSNQKGITDFTFSSTRVAGEGNLISQDIGGDAIFSVKVGQDGAYYSLKQQSAYRLEIAADDNTFTNLVYRTDIGIPYFRASVSTSKGIVFMNTANPDKPELTILQRNPLGDNIEPVALFNHFKFSNYDYSDCCIDTWERYVIIACKRQGSTLNDTILVCDLLQSTVDITYYGARMFAKDSGNLYVGSEITESVYQIFNGFDDEGLAIENYWISKGEQYAKAIAEYLKKTRKLRLKGIIDPDQVVEISISYDDAGFEVVGTIRGDASYVDYTNPQVVGGNMIGEVQIGGDDVVEAYPFFMEIKLKTPKFRKRTIKIQAKGIGYFDLDTIIDFDILLFEKRIPKRFRQKQNVSLDGADINQ
jgi:hypothetical protein